MHAAQAEASLARTLPGASKSTKFWDLNPFCQSSSEHAANETTQAICSAEAETVKL